MVSDWLLKEPTTPLRKPADGLHLRSEVSFEELAQQLAFDVQRDLLVYWNVIRRETPIPSRSDFDPLGIPQALPYLGLIDIIEPGPQFRYRLIGTKLPAYAGGRLEGRLVDDHKTASYAAYLNCVYELPYRFRQPVFIRECAVYEDGSRESFARLLLPLALDLNMPNMLMISIIRENRDVFEPPACRSTPRNCTALTMVSARPPH
ncbi:PAS domain-containing protein [Pelagibius sp. Alg239-R121]|uniref:PAS domain-containing protein n=1 Tax=Pelagibius sp. Alg239-R121 TaxID=2993448 RepID=UPI0024A7262D|nr:PAS domain-containing protein [Pelagibius sp. Alg239-R121]